MVLTMMRHESKQLLTCKKKFYYVLSIGCFSALPDCSYTSARQDVTVVAMDDILFSRSSNDCKRFCDDARYNFRSILYFFFKIIGKCIFSRAFNCRSYAQKGDRCYLSGDDSVTLQGVPQPVDIGAVYKEKACTRSK